MSKSRLVYWESKTVQSLKFVDSVFKLCSIKQRAFFWLSEYSIQNLWSVVIWYAEYISDVNNLLVEIKDVVCPVD